VESFSLTSLVGQFDQARSINSSLTSWALTNALMSAYLGGSDSAALGGDLAYEYGKNGNLANLSFNPAVGILSSAQFGNSAQALQPAANLVDNSPRLG
jgi:hypothetical protein